MEKANIIEKAIEGYNKEKQILTEKLSTLSGITLNTTLRSSIETRLSDIDELIITLLKDKEL